MELCKNAWVKVLSHTDEPCSRFPSVSGILFTAQCCEVAERGWLRGNDFSHCLKIFLSQNLNKGRGSQDAPYYWTSVQSIKPILEHTLPECGEKKEREKQRVRNMEGEDKASEIWVYSTTLKEIRKRKIKGKKDGREERTASVWPVQRISSPFRACYINI